jgi:hypothetical protein
MDPHLFTRRSSTYRMQLVQRHFSPTSRRQGSQTGASNSIPSSPHRVHPLVWSDARVRYLSPFRLKAFSTTSYASSTNSLMLTCVRDSRIALKIVSLLTATARFQRVPHCLTMARYLNLDRAGRFISIRRSTSPLLPGADCHNSSSPLVTAADIHRNSETIHCLSLLTSRVTSHPSARRTIFSRYCTQARRTGHNEVAVQCCTTQSRISFSDSPSTKVR